jgi:hypothetical protein
VLDSLKSAAINSRSSATAISCPGTVPGQCGVLIAGIARH